ncbi:MAG: HNH endonuclease, partial [Pseudobdellovibrionaceae bacterium]
DLFLRLCEKLIKSKTQLNKSAQSKTQPSKSARSNGQPSRGVGNQTQTSATQGVLGAGTRSRYIPQHIRKAVFVRDGFQCRFKTEEGHICGGRMFLQPHHIKAFAKGGEHTLANLSLRCHAHNQFEAKLEGLERKVPFTV